MPEDSDYLDLPPGIIVMGMLELVCPHCSKIHSIPIELKRISKEGVLAQLARLQALFLEEGYRVPTAAEFAMRDVMREEKKAAEEKKFFFIDRKGREGGDA
jgi:hypothetical protein